MVSRPVRSSLLAVAAAAWAAGCATAPPKVVELRKPFLPYQLAPQRAERPSNGPLRTAQTLGEPGVQEIVPAVRIDGDLLRFAMEQRQARFTTDRGKAMPPAVRSNWSALLGQVDTLLRQPANRILPLDAVRARVALDAELEMDKDHYMSLPDGLAAGIKARSQALDQRMAEIRLLKKQVRPAKTRLTWPIDPVVVTSLFGMRADPFSGEDRDHQGVDLKAEVGQLIQASAEGTVIRAGRYGGHGMHVEIEHGDGVVTGYSHMSTVLVTEGMHVSARGPVGLAGNTGRSTGPHLHFEVWRAGEAVDPLAELPDPAFEDFTSTAIGDGP